MSGRDIVDLSAAILRAGEDDYLDLSYLTYLTEETLATRDPEAVRSRLLESIRRLLRSGQLRAGDLEPPGEFVAWPLSPDDAYQRIEAELSELGRPIRTGEVVWFEVPEE